VQRRVAAFETENQAQSMKETLVHLDIYLYLFVFICGDINNNFLGHHFA